MIVNGFLNVRYGMGDWVLEYEDKCVYLNHNLIYERGLDLAEVQNEVAIFAMQFRGVSRPLGDGHARTRATSGAAMPARCKNASTPAVRATSLNLMPGWIEEQERAAGRRRGRCTATTRRCRWYSTASASGRSA